MTRRRHPGLRIAVTTMVLLAACGDDSFLTNRDTVDGSGTIETESRDVDGYDEISILGSGMVSIVIDGTESLTVEADDNILPLLTTDVDGGHLELGVRPNTNISPSREVVYTITAATMQAVTILGSGDVTVAGLEGGDFELAILGSGNAELIGSVSSLEVSIPGSGDIRADQLSATAATVSVNGSGSALVNATEALDVSINGSGSVSYLGDPVVSQSINGSGSVQPG